MTVAQVTSSIAQLNNLFLQLKYSTTQQSIFAQLCMKSVITISTQSGLLPVQGWISLIPRPSTLPVRKNTASDQKLEA